MASCCLPSAFHIWPEVRIAAGIDASMITSLGAWRFVMPRAESTIASGGPLSYAASIACSIAPRCSSGSASIAFSSAPSPSFGLTPADFSASPYSSNTSAKYARTACPKMIGSDTRIIVVFRWTENSTPRALRVGDLVG